MNFILNFGFAWLSVLVGLILASKYCFRKLGKNNPKIAEYNSKTRKLHIPLGILLIFTGFVHGINSFGTVWSINIGTGTWVVSILLGLSYFARSIFAKKSMWIVVHRCLTAVFLLCIILHIVDVGGIRIFNFLR